MKYFSPYTYLKFNVLIILTTLPFLTLGCLAYIDFHDFSSVLENKDKFVKLGEENRLIPLGATINLLCRDEQPFSIVVKWRMPMRNRITIKNHLEDDWFKNGNSLSLDQYPPVQILASSGNFKNTEHIGLSNFDIVQQDWADTLVSKPLHQNSIKQLDKSFHSKNRFSFHTAESMFRFQVTNEVKSSNITELCKN